MKKNSTGVSVIIKSLLRQKGDVIYYFILTLVASLLSMAVPASIGFITDWILSSGIRESVLVMGLSVILVALASLCISILVNRINVRVQSRSEYGIFAFILKHIMQMNSRDEKEMSRHLIGTFQTFLVGIDEFISSLFSAVIYGIQLLFIFILMIIRGYDPPVLIGIFTAIIISVVIILILLRKTNQAKIIERENRSDYVNFSRELLDNMEAVKNTGSEEEMMERLTTLYRNYMPYKMKAENNMQWVSVLLTSLSGVGIWVIIFVTSVNLNSTTGETAVIISMFSLLTGYLSMFIKAVFGMASGKNQLKFAEEVLEKPTELYDEAGIKPDITGSISLDHVEFSYSNSGKPVFKDLSLNIDRGAYIGIVGSSGCGKSTLIRLLLGFEKPDRGTIRFDGVDISECNVQALRRQFGVVMQDAALISASIAANIGLAEHPDMEAVEKASKTADIYDDIMAMPMKFNTLVSGESELVSGGQRQRIVLARALMNNPKILILDEATSAMDNATQKIVKENLDALGITRIVAAHRLSTVRDCDRIIVLDRGEIAEDGTFDELMEQNGLFAKLAKRNLK